MANKKIAKVDNDAMNSLYGAEFARLAGKTADWQDENGAPHAAQAFADHKAYLDTLKSVLAESESDSDANGVYID